MNKLGVHIARAIVQCAVRRAPTTPRTTSAACRRRGPPGPGPPLGTRPAHGPTPLRLPPCSLATAPRWQIAIARPSWPAQKLSQKSEIGFFFSKCREETFNPPLLGGGYACSADRGLRRWARCLSCLFLLPQVLGEHICLPCGLIAQRSCAACLIVDALYCLYNVMCNRTR